MSRGSGIRGLRSRTIPNLVISAPTPGTTPKANPSLPSQTRTGLGFAVPSDMTYFLAVVTSPLISTSSGDISSRGERSSRHHICTSIATHNCNHISIMVSSSSIFPVSRVTTTSGRRELPLNLCNCLDTARLVEGLLNRQPTLPDQRNTPLTKLGH